MKKDSTRNYTVHEINNLIKFVLEDNLPGRLNISAEISNWKGHASGHRYFILKDSNAQIPAVMWRSSAAKLKFEPEDGMSVLARGYIDVYPPHGKYQFVVDSLKPAGVGDLLLAFEQLLEKLQTKGYFDDKYKQPLPKYPFRIGILTSSSGAAVHDISDSICNRWNCAKLFLYPVPVQGKGAELQIASAIRDINNRNDELMLDLLIVGRGGGSIEDLWCFNEEVVANAIFESKIPIISAVGHEVDTTIADLVADARASTPTKAGLIAVPDMAEVLGQFQSHESRMKRELASRLRLAAQKLSTVEASAVFRDPSYSVRYKTSEVDQLEGYLQRSFADLISSEKTKLASIEGCLRGLNPKSILKRGFSITRSKVSGEILSGDNLVESGECIITEIDGDIQLESEVK